MPKSQAKQRPTLKPLAIVLAAVIIITIFIILALLLAPGDSLPEFEITDQNGVWRSQGPLVVFDDLIKPGSKGEYKFIIRNESDADLSYGIRLSEYLDNINHDAEAFMLYRLKVGNIYIDNSDWHQVDYKYNNVLDYNEIIILPGSEQLMTLEWWWPFESGRDENDTLIGTTGGKLSVTFFLWAEVVEE